MAEAHGIVVIKGDQKILSFFSESDDGVDWNSMNAFFQAVGVGSLKEGGYKLASCEGNMFFHEGISHLSDGISISIFGDEWMPAMQYLVKNGKEIEVYGSIYDEYGVSEYYALNYGGDIFFGTYDGETDETSNKEAVLREWLSKIPELVKSECFKSFLSLPTGDYSSGDVDTESCQNEKYKFIPFYEKDGEKVFNFEIFLDCYNKSFLEDGKKQGVLPYVDSYCRAIDEKLKSHLLTFAISNLEKTIGERVAFALDVLDVYGDSIDMNERYGGYSNSFGTPLYLAAEFGMFPVVVRLLELGADPSVEFKYGPSGTANPIEIATVNKRRPSRFLEFVDHKYTYLLILRKNTIWHKFTRAIKMKSIG